MVQAGVVRNSGRNWTSDRGCTCGWQEPGHKGTCTKCMVDADIKGSLLSVEEDLGCWRARVSSDLLLGRRMRDLGFLGTVPALPCLIWVNLSSCSLRIFDFFIFFLNSTAICVFGKLCYYSSNSKIQSRREKGREGAQEGGL